MKVFLVFLFFVFTHCFAKAKFDENEFLKFSVNQTKNNFNFQKSINYKFFKLSDVNVLVLESYYTMGLQKESLRVVIPTIISPVIIRRLDIKRESKQNRPNHTLENGLIEIMTKPIFDWAHIQLIGDGSRLKIEYKKIEDDLKRQIEINEITDLIELTQLFSLNQDIELQDLENIFQRCSQSLF